MGETRTINAKLCLLDQDVSTAFGTASGNAITPPEYDYATAQIEIIIDESDILDLVEKLGGQLEIDRETDDPEITVKDRKITIVFNVIGKEPFQKTGATYEHFSFGRI